VSFPPCSKITKQNTINEILCHRYRIINCYNKTIIYTVNHFSWPIAPSVPLFYYIVQEFCKFLKTSLTTNQLVHGSAVSKQVMNQKQTQISQQTHLYLYILLLTDLHDRNTFYYHFLRSAFLFHTLFNYRLFARSDPPNNFLNYLLPTPSPTDPKLPVLDTFNITPIMSTELSWAMHFLKKLFCN
jgi:hypothetical protein